jgi:membrane protein DedA with SNARE-associated domain
MVAKSNDVLVTPLALISLKGALASYGYLAVFAFVGIESLGIPFPGETMLVTAAIYAGATGNLSIALVVAAAAAGAIIGDNVGYGIGYWGGYRLVVRYGKYVRLD